MGSSQSEVVEAQSDLYQIGLSLWGDLYAVAEYDHLFSRSANPRVRAPW